MNIWNDLPSPLRQKVIKSIWVALNNLILHENGANNTPAIATKPRRVVLNKTAMEALMMEPDIETPIISAIRIPIAKDLFSMMRIGLTIATMIMTTSMMTYTAPGVVPSDIVASSWMIRSRMRGWRTRTRMRMWMRMRMRTSTRT
jgi:hypothetical protein